VPHLKNPLVLAGFCLFLFVEIWKGLLKAGILSPLSQRQSSVVVRLILRYGFWLSILAMVSGVGYAAYQVHTDASRAVNQSGTGIQQSGDCSANVNGNHNSTSVNCTDTTGAKK